MARLVDFLTVKINAEDESSDLNLVRDFISVPQPMLNSTALLTLLVTGCLPSILFST
jgi:hypothetical protein